MSLAGVPEPIDVDPQARVVARIDSFLERDGEMLVLRGRDLALLPPLASAVLTLARDEPQRGVAVSDLGQRLLKQFGTPVDVDPDVAVRQVIADLVDRGFLEVLAPQ